MLESILQQFHQAEYDFRETANPDDPLTYLFEEWVNYYKLKWAIARILQPSSILEVGVRYGYSAAAFLQGCPTAKYYGIDLDTDQFGGVKGAINWAKKITQPFNAEYLVADTQTMSRFPGGVYDLIHVDGQQDGNGSFHDLQLAVNQSHYVLVDGYLWTTQNFTAINDFLFRYSDIFDFYWVIPGYAGELLIKVADHHLAAAMQQGTDNNGTVLSTTLRNTYTTEYYTQDCGGFEAYQAHHGKKLEDARLQTVAAIADAFKAQGRFLDLGCGRGELTYRFAKAGFGVTAIDYSQAAIDLAEQCFVGEEQLKQSVEFYCDDVCTAPLTGKYDLAIASDVIEHLAPAEVDRLYERVAQHLADDGVFVLHTAPSLWYYKYHYARKRKIAASVGAYLPFEPRSRYELLMHINEQSPPVMRKQLQRHFKHVEFWFGELDSPGGSLVKHYSIAEMRATSSLFAVVSHQPIQRSRLINSLQMQSLPPETTKLLKLAVLDCPNSVKANQEFSIAVCLVNHSKFILNSYPPHPVQISYHWMDKKDSTCIIFEGHRTKLLPSLHPTAPDDTKFWSKLFSSNVISGREICYQVRVKAPPQPESFILRITLVQEGVFWWDSVSPSLFQALPIEVK